MRKSFKYNRLSKDDAVLLLVDHQSSLISLVQDFSPNEFKNNVLALTACGKYFEPPALSMRCPVTRLGCECSPQVCKMVNWLGVACELHRDWRNDVEGLGALLSSYIPNYRNLMTSLLCHE
jgi:hypothetical protein